ncbi:MAG: hypothetical protein K0Q49_1683 [Haloplasmataceae bacterium]|jgi:hypothetical protein|nr:hypothetical protein [Haloplasmataceae bacterium]
MFPHTYHVECSVASKKATYISVYLIYIRHIATLLKINYVILIKS